MGYDVWVVVLCCVLVLGLLWLLGVFGYWFWLI